MYKVIIKKVVFVDADTEDEAEDLVFSGDTISEEEWIVKTQKVRDDITIPFKM